MLAAVIGIRDPLWPEGDPSLPELIHGSAFERVTAFQTGFDDGISSCVRITPEEVTTHRGNLPQEFIEKGQTGEFAINADSVKTALDSLKKLFPLDNPPALSFGGPSCPDGPSGPVASYCPSSNTIAVDLPRLILMGTSLSRGSPFDLMPNSLFGDYTAYSVLVSRYMLAVQNEHGGLALDDVDAALRTACLTGVATAKLAKGVTSAAGNTVALSGGDLDEAVSGLLTNGLAASDVHGQAPPSGFARIDAFRNGVLGSQGGCFDAWP